MDQSNLIKKLEQELALAQSRIAQLEQLVETDVVCSVANRRGFEKALQGSIERHARYHEQTALLYCDLDGFKALNDRYGHEAGDEALRFFAQFLKLQCRSTDTIARLGGDEFAVLLPHATLEDAKARLSEWREALVKHPARLSFSAGCILVEDETLRESLKRADAAMYRDKTQRRVVGIPLKPFIKSSLALEGFADAPTAL